MSNQRIVTDGVIVRETTQKQTIVADGFILAETFSGVVPITFTGPNISSLFGTVGISFGFDASTRFDGTETPITYSVQSGPLPGGLTLDPDTGVISGIPSASGTFGGIVIRASDSGGNPPADSNSFSITIAAAPSGTASISVAMI